MEYQAVISGIIRHILTASGGGAVVAALLTGGTIEAIVGGAITLGGFVWSIIKNKKK